MLNPYYNNLETLGFAGGGGSDSWSNTSWSSDRSYDTGWTNNSWQTSSHSDISSTLKIIILLIAIASILLSLWRSKKEGLSSSSSPESDQPLSPSDRAQISTLLSQSDHNDTAREKWVHTEAEKIFLTYQADWSNFNLKNIPRYTTEQYAAHAKMMLLALKSMGRQNIASDLILHKTSLLTEIKDDSVLPKNILIQFKYGGADTLKELNTGRNLFCDRIYSAFELWHFIYDGTSLKLDGISQPTESDTHLIKSLAEFAKANNFFYNKDYGRNILPTRGLIFDNASFSTSDVNNYLVGQWGNCLIQLYSYSAQPNLPDNYYLVGQISVPKTYNGIIIESIRKKLRPLTIPKDYEQFSLEWEEFNRKYHVYAKSQDALPTFELLNPKFMAELYDKQLDYTLEVVDNIIYLFAEVTTIKETDYLELFNILLLAFKELEL